MGVSVCALIALLRAVRWPMLIYDVSAQLDQRILDRLQCLLDIEAAIFKLLFGNIGQGYLTILGRGAAAGRSGGSGAPQVSIADGGSQGNTLARRRGGPHVGRPGAGGAQGRNMAQGGRLHHHRRGGPDITLAMDQESPLPQERPPAIRA
jgi:hypothetical protein